MCVCVCVYVCVSVCRSEMLLSINFVQKYVCMCVHAHLSSKMGRDGNDCCMRFVVLSGESKLSSSQLVRLIS